MHSNYESDLARSEKRKLEWQKIQSLHGRARLEYLWSYYKAVPVILMFCLLIVAAAATMLQNRRTVPVLSVVIVDADRQHPEKYEALCDELLLVIAPGERHAAVTADTSVTSKDDDNEQMNAAIKLSIAAEQDLVVCNDSVLRRFQGEDAFADWRKLLGSDYPRYQAYLTNGMLDLTKSPKWNSGAYTASRPAYLCALQHSEHPEAVKRFAAYYFS